MLFLLRGEDLTTISRGITSLFVIIHNCLRYNTHHGYQIARRIISFLVISLVLFWLLLRL